jgi:hypothetical protein
MSKTAWARAVNAMVIPTEFAVCAAHWFVVQLASPVLIKYVVVHQELSNVEQFAAILIHKYAVAIKWAMLLAAP